MTDLLLGYLGSTFVLALVGFCIIWWRQSQLPSSLSALKRLVLFAIIWGACFAASVILHISTAFSGVPYSTRLEDLYMFLTGLIGYIVGSSVIGLMLKSKKS
jgi:hypothetical protein